MTLARSVVYRLAGSVLTLLGVSLVVFIVLRAIPGNAITAALGVGAGALTPQQLASLRHYYGLDRPLPSQYITWMGDLLHGNLGVSLTSGQPVRTLISSAVPVTVELAVIAVLLGAVTGVVLGLIAAGRPGGMRDVAVQGVGLLGLAIPDFVLGTAVVTILAAVFSYFPDTGSYVPLTTSVSGNLRQMLYPSLVLAVAVTANVMRTTRSEYAEVSRADFVRTAVGKGVPARRIRIVHVLRNSLVPIATLTGIQFGYLLGGTVIIEQIFALPGLGRLLYTAISDRDYPLVEGAVLVIAVFFVLVNLVVDLLYQVIDPRTRTS
jgi:peptide/nickel transport system permease protein